MQSLNVQSFFRAIIIPAAYGLELFLITFFANMLRSCSHTFDFSASGVRLDRMLTGALSLLLFQVCWGSILMSTVYYIHRFGGGKGTWLYIFLYLNCFWVFIYV
jgi:hypothetical protein